MKGIKYKIRRKWYLRWLLLLTNWIAQGIINADNTEKIYKISFTILSSIFFYIILNLNFKFSIYLKVFISFVTGHTINWIINGSLATILLHRLFISNITKEKVFSYLQALIIRMKSIDYLIVCAVFGSIARGDIKKTSDIDITFVRKPGIINAIKSILFMVSEKFRTNVHLIPIEPFLADSISFMKNRYKGDEIPVIIKNNSKEFSNYFDMQQTLEEAAIKNNYTLRNA